MAEQRIGTVAAYDVAGQAAQVTLSAALQVGDRIHIVGRGQEIEEVVAALKVDRSAVAAAQAGQNVGVWCPEQVHQGDQVYLVE